MAEGETRVCLSTPQTAAKCRLSEAAARSQVPSTASHGYSSSPCTGKLLPAYRCISRTLIKMPLQYGMQEPKARLNPLCKSSGLKRLTIQVYSKKCTNQNLDSSFALDSFSLSVCKLILIPFMWGTHSPVLHRNYYSFTQLHTFSSFAWPFSLRSNNWHRALRKHVK